MPIDPSIILGLKSPPIDSPSEAIGKVLSLRQLHQQIQQGDALEQERRLRIAQQQRELADSQTVDEILPGAFIPDPDTGVPRFNRAAAEQGLVQRGRGHLYPKYAEMFDKLEKDADDFAARRRALAARTIFGLQQLDEMTPNGVKAAAAYLQKTEAFTPAQLQPVLDAVGQNPTPEAINQVLTRLGSKIPEYRELVNAEEKRQLEIREKTADVQVKERAARGRSLEDYQQILDTSIPTTDKDNAPLRARTQSRLTAALKFGDYKAADKALEDMSQELRSLEVATNPKAIAGKIQVIVGGQTGKDTDAAKGVSDEAITQAADKYYATGEMSGLGMGNAVLRRQIMNRAAERHPGTALAANSAEYKANTASLTNLQKQRDAIGAFEQTAKKNLAQFLEAAKEVVDTGSPLINKPLRSLSQQVLGSPQMAAYNTARRVVIPEFAKILNNPTLAGQLSDSARHEVDDLLKGDATLKQVQEVARILVQDVENRTSAMDDQIADIKRRVSASPAVEVWERGPDGKLRKKTKSE